VPQEIRRDFPLLTEAHATAWGRESQAEEAGRRSEPRQGHAVGCDGKKEPTLARLRKWVWDLQARYACASGISAKLGCTMATAEFTSCSGVKAG